MSDHIWTQREKFTICKTCGVVQLRSGDDGPCGSKFVGPFSDEPYYCDSWGNVVQNMKAWKQDEASTSSPVLGRDFDAGVVPDLHTQEFADDWRALGKDYVDHTGPIISNNRELHDFMKMTGHVMKDQSSIVEESRGHGAFGYTKKRKKRVKVVNDGYEEVFGRKFRREKSDILDGRERQKEENADVSALHSSREKRRQGVRRIFGVGNFNPLNKR